MVDIEGSFPGFHNERVELVEKSLMTPFFAEMSADAEGAVGLSSHSVERNIVAEAKSEVAERKLVRNIMLALEGARETITEIAAVTTQRARAQQRT